LYAEEYEPFNDLLTRNNISILYIYTMRGILRIILATLFACFAVNTLAQEVDSVSFCDKKWYCEMTKDAEGNVLPQEKGSEDNYMYFKCDNTFKLSESGILLEGTWSYDNETRLITLTQKQLNNIPESFSFHIVDSDEGHMVIVAGTGSASQEIAYLITKK